VGPEVRNLTLHPGIAVLALNVRADRSDQVAHLPDAAVGRLEAEPKLVGGSHAVEFTAHSVQHSAFTDLVFNSAKEEK
jgi:hypothetical protein